MIAAEFGVLFAVLAIPFLLGGTWIADQMALNTSVAFTAESAAASAARALAKGTQDDARAAANAVIAANKQNLFRSTATVTAVVTFPNGNVQVKIDANVPGIIQWNGLTTVSASATATD